MNSPCDTVRIMDLAMAGVVVQGDRLAERITLSLLIGPPSALASAGPSTYTGLKL